jgi:hypothetical protein
MTVELGHYDVKARGEAPCDRAPLSARISARVNQDDALAQALLFVRNGGTCDVFRPHLA